jgi:hypothetical protein
MVDMADTMEDMDMAEASVQPTIDYNNYIEGTLFINVVDKAEEKIVWQG